MSATRLPVVSGPVEGGKGWIFGSPIDDLRERGYVMEEYFLDGTALSYQPVAGSELGIDGLWDVELAEEAAYKTRAYVVRPADPADFNGIVLVNWQNVTIGVDFGMPDLEQLEHGYAWVGITTQHVAHDGQPALTEDMPATVGLREWDPAATDRCTIPATRSPTTSSARRPDVSGKALRVVSTCSVASRRGC